MTRNVGWGRASQLAIGSHSNAAAASPLTTSATISAGLVEAAPNVLVAEIEVGDPRGLDGHLGFPHAWSSEVMEESRE